MIISKELFKAVTGKDVKNIYELGSNSNLSDSELPYGIYGNGDLYVINIYELVHKCKEWAFNQGRVLHTYSRPTVFNCVCKINYGKEYEVNTFILDSEPEAVFKACQWIFDNMEIK